MRKKPKIIPLNESNDLFVKWIEGVYDANFERLYRYAFSITKNKQLAEDVVSEVFMNIWDKKPDYTNIKELSSYLHVSVKHLAIRMVSKDPHRFFYSIYDETLQISDDIDPESLLLGNELSILISEVFDSVAPQSKLVYDMARNKGYSNQKIAEELGISIRTVESHIYSVLKKMKIRLQAHFQESDKTYNFLLRVSPIFLLTSSLTHFLL